jgi:hypothetical protein
VSEPTSPLEPRDVALLRDARDAEPPGPEVHARVRARLAANVPGMHPGHGGGGGSAVAGSALGKATIAATALLIGGVGGAGLYSELRRPPPPQVVYIPQPVLVPTPLREPPPAPSAAPIEPLPSPSAVGVARSTPSSASSSSRTAQLGAERILLDEARGALVQGDPNRALGRLEQHRRTFASPILGEERDAMEVEALVKAGRTAEARAKADAFGRRTPNSLFLPAVESAIESIP